MTRPAGGGVGSAPPGLVARFVLVAVAVAVPFVAVGIGIAVALSSAAPGTRGGLVAALVAWAVAVVAATAGVASFAWAVVRPARALARGLQELADGGAGDDLPSDREDEFGRAARAARSLARDRERLRGELQDAALRDPETGFYDARELRLRLDQEEARARRHERPFALVVVDVDRPDGDVVAVAAALRSAVRPTDVVARLGQTAFAALLPETTADGATHVVSRLRSGLGPGVAAVGVAEHPVAGTTGEQVLRAALAALDGSRRSGGDAVTYGA